MKEPKASTSTPKNYIDIDPDKNMVTLFDTSILVAVVNGEIDLNNLAIRELQNRGLDLKGNWVGFTKNSQ